ncbi:MAG TPA: PRC-barrel domain-containing protein [Longimicrobiales bacterium]
MRAPPLYGPGPGEPQPLRPVPDLAGTPVEDVQGEHAGIIYGALADADTGLIRYLDLALEDTGRHVLVPLGHARIERETGARPQIRLRAATRDDLEEIPPFEPHGDVDGPYQQALLAAHGRFFYGERYYAHPAYDHAGLYAGEHPIVREPTAPRSPAPLERLSDLPGYRVATGEPDIRGWRLITGQGHTTGIIEDLVVDPRFEKVRYVIVRLSRPPERVLIPVGFLQIDQPTETVRTPALSDDDIHSLPPYRLGAVTRADEERVRKAIEKRLDGDRRFQRPDFAPIADRARR